MNSLCSKLKIKAKPKNNHLVMIQCISSVLLLSLLLIVKSLNDLQPFPYSLQNLISDVSRLQIVDRHGTPLTVTYQNRWNTNDYVHLYEIPEFLQKIFIASEDKRFFEHHGVDWYARFHALWQNVFALETVRGASTITEQVVRMIHPRPRTLWSRWLEGLEAARLEEKMTKADILEFYLNQVPYASNRRGVVQAARYYFDRDLDTLSHKEILTLAVLVRAPTYFDLYKNPQNIIPPIERLVVRLNRSGLLTDQQYLQIYNEEFSLTKPKLPVNAAHFIRYIYKNTPQQLVKNKHRLNTTLDGNLQQNVQAILDQCVKDLKNRRVQNGAALVVDHTRNEILAWAVAGEGDENVPAGLINAVTTLRQPGSSMKPFLYALALEKGWTAATLLDDSPLSGSVGKGIHDYRNYNHQFYGPVTLRQGLGNSLNIPAIRAIRFVGVDNYLARLRDLGFNSLTEHPEFYGDGLALGNGEVTLFELVQAFTTLARRGNFLPLTALEDQLQTRQPTKIFSQEVTSLIANILSDPEARYLEFGSNSVLNFPVQTAVKTGTSSDYRDALAVGFDYHYTAGVWMGNLDSAKTDGVTGSIGPAMALRSIFSELNKIKQTRPLYLSPKLVQRDVCNNIPANGDGDCSSRTEFFIAGTEPENRMMDLPEEPLAFQQPSNGLQIAMDPRIPDEYEAFEFNLAGVTAKEIVDWRVDNVNVGKTQGGKYLWPLKKGKHTVMATIWKDPAMSQQTDEIQFIVK